MAVYMNLVPAYGRDYRSQKDLLADWNAGKDFEISDFGPNCGRKINKAQAQKGTTYTIRYAQLRKICVVKG